MKITFYNITDENEVVNKKLGDAILIGDDSTLSFKIKKPTNYQNLQLTFQTAPLIDKANYCLIEQQKSNQTVWKRYYYITDRIFENGKMQTLILKEDVLKSFENEIMTSKTFIERSENGGNTYIEDTQYPLSTKRKVLFNSLGHFDSTLYNYLVVTGGASS